MALVLAGVLVGCGSPVPIEFIGSAAPEFVPVTAPPSPAPSRAERDGLVLEAEMRATTTELVVDVVVRNDRAEPVHLVPDQCGRVSQVLLVRTRFEPEGRRWSGSLQAAKDLVLDGQLARQAPDRFHPPGAAADADRDAVCPRPDRPIELAAGEELTEHWELPRFYARSLDVVGSEGSAVRAQIVESRSPDALELLDIYSYPDAEEVWAGRDLRVERPAAELISTRPPSRSDEPSLGQLFDRLVSESEELRAWIEAQPADGWRLGQLTPAYPGSGPEYANVRLRLVTTEFERAASATAAADGSDVEVTLPAEEDRAREFARRPGTLPPGIALIPEPEAYELTEDLLLPDLVLPSGRLVVGEYLLEEEVDVVTASLPPGRYPVHATLARYRAQDFDSVALATLTVSTEPTVRWEYAGIIPVDGGSATFTSGEGQDAGIAQFETDESGWERFWLETVLDSHAAHDWLATEVDVDDDLNLAQFSSGTGDGGYPVYIGYDAADRPTAVVVDFFLLHLGWPADAG